MLNVRTSKFIAKGKIISNCLLMSIEYIYCRFSIESDCSEIVMDVFVTFTIGYIVVSWYVSKIIIWEKLTIYFKLIV